MIEEIPELGENVLEASVSPLLFVIADLTLGALCHLQYDHGTVYELECESSEPDRLKALL